MAQSIKAHVLFKALADESRVKLVQQLAEKPSYVEVLAEKLKLSASTVSFHLKKLESAGVVSKQRDQYYQVYKLNKPALNKSILNFILHSEQSDQVAESRESAYEKKVISTFIKYGRLQSIPVQRKKRTIVLNHLATLFQSEKDYPEVEVNKILESYHEDYATLRRELIAEKIMKRSAGIYRRL